MTKELERLLEIARRITMSPEEQEHQRRSFAYGNSRIENQDITREMVDEAAEKIGAASWARKT